MAPEKRQMVSEKMRESHIHVSTDDDEIDVDGTVTLQDAVRPYTRKLARPKLLHQLAGCFLLAISIPGFIYFVTMMFSGVPLLMLSSLYPPLISLVFFIFGIALIGEKQYECCNCGTVTNKESRQCGMCKKTFLKTLKTKQISASDVVRVIAVAGILILVTVTAAVTVYFVGGLLGLE